LEGKGIFTTFALVIIKQVNIMETRRLDFDKVDNEYYGGMQFDATDGNEYLVYGAIDEDTKEEVVAVYQYLGVRPISWAREIELTPNKERDMWFDNLLIRELVSTEEFFHIWADYNCTCPQAFADVCTDIWYNGWTEDDRWDFYKKYKTTFKGEKSPK
jgi:hypothetical protein